MARFYMAVGIAGAGKSTVYRNHYSFAEYVSSDAIREEVYGDVNDQSHNEEVFNFMSKRTREFLKNGADVFYDATNISSKRRMGFLRELSKIPNVQKICVLVVPPFEVVKEQNANRERKVPEYALERMYRNFNMPHESEGWDKIEVFGNQRNYEYLFSEHLAAKGIPHDNPHHSASIGKHMELAGEYIRQHFKKELASPDRNICYPAEMMVLAADFHDIGKPYCKVYHNAKGEPTEDAHYYNHENVGSYIYISHSDGDEHDIWIANLIAHHMDYFKGEKYMEKVRSRFGEKFMKDLDILHEADLAAH